ncbi:ubiquitin-like domain-containing protein [Ectobacillus antri]|uniref:Ubiquitin-like domain-containing protein n=1 Tax=Ectobacillus antri TaxID=2486280 RepID=A0ABT6H6Z6_9BACI|nr:G5 and 3D domain-containing protein [Ectobacillus antri]MDG4657991.1 ubiquitin-like domain-containing protein [Ectobacillus antri]MDG5755023.1 ubiquitin-like domain-containing protein [Ectobacillus antri]
MNTKNLLLKLRTSKKLAVKLTSALVISSSVGTAAYAGTKDNVTVDVEGKKEAFRTHADTVGELLKEKGITISKYDHVTPSASAKVTDNMSIVVEKAEAFTLVVNGKKRELKSPATTVKELLKNEGIELGEHDKVTPSLDTPLKENDTVTVRYAFALTLNIGGEEKQIWSTSDTVADLLDEQQVKLNETDRVEPSRDQTITPNMHIKVTHVEKVSDVVEEVVPFAIVKQKDSSLAVGTEKVLQEGEEGKVQKTFEVIKENGVEVSRAIRNQVTLKESKDKIIAVGTMQTAAAEPSRGSDGGVVADEYYVEATAYSPYCRGCQGTSAGGYNYKANPNMKLIAVDPRIIPLGTKVWVEGYGYAIAGDTGGAIKGRKIDVLMPTEAQASAWGRKRVKIRILR